MKKRIAARIIPIAIIALVLSVATWHQASADRGGESGREFGTIYVTSQELYYQTFGAADPLPPIGPFQLLEMGPNGPQTEYGPGDPGYVGGRWKEDFDGDGIFHYFECPLLGPGSEEAP